jgi:hypothetical protein
MLPVHFDPFLYVMREKNNWLFLREYKVKVRLFLGLQWKQRGEGVPSGRVQFSMAGKPVQVRGIWCPLRVETQRRGQDSMRKVSSRDI